MNLSLSIVYEKNSSKWKEFWILSFTIFLLKLSYHIFFEKYRQSKMENINF